MFYYLLEGGVEIGYFLSKTANGLYPTGNNKPQLKNTDFDHFPLVFL